MCVKKQGVRLHQQGFQNGSLSDLARSLQDTILSHWIHKENRNPNLTALSSGSPVNPHSTNVCSTAAAFPTPKKHERANLLNTSMWMRVSSNGLQTTVL